MRGHHPGRACRRRPRSGREVNRPEARGRISVETETQWCQGLEAVRMNVLFVTLAFDPGHVSPFPGVNRYSVELAKALAMEGVETTVASPLQGTLPSRETWNGIDVYRFPDSKTRAGRLGVIAELNLVTFALNLRRHSRHFHDSDIVFTNLPLFPTQKAWAPTPTVYFLHHA